MQACERDEPQRACLEAGRHICGTRLAFTLPINRETHCPGCESVSNAEQYCKAHASNVTLEEVQAIFADADTSQAPKSGAVPLTNESDKSREARTLRPVSAFIRAGHAATMRRHGFAGDCVCEACILGEEGSQT